MSDGVADRLLGTREEAQDYMPLLRWMVLISLVLFGVVVLAYFGLIQVMLETDRTRLSLLILGIFVLTSLHCLYQTLAISRELVATRIAAAKIRQSSGKFTVVGDRVLTNDGAELPPGVLSRHIGNLVEKVRTQEGRRLDQTLLLRSLADQLRSRD
jgi:hypothetical protein